MENIFGIKEDKGRIPNVMEIRTRKPSALQRLKFQSQAVNTQDKDYKSIEKEIIRNEKRIGT